MIPEHYTIKNLYKSIHNPEKIINELKYIKFKYKNPVYENIIKKGYGGCENVMDKDWDNLIILDACRYDIFKDVNFIDGE